MLSRLAGAVARGSKQLLQATAASATHASTVSVMGQYAGSSVNNLQQHAWRQLQQQLHSLRQQGWRAYSSSEGAAKKSHSILESVAEAQMQRMLKESGKAAGGAGPQQPPSTASRIFDMLVDAVALGLGGLVVFGGYYSVAYRSTGDLEDMLRDAKASLKLADEAAATVASTPAAPAGGAAAPAAPAAPAPASRSGPPVEPAAFPPLTRAWCAVMDKYLQFRVYIEKSIKDYQDPTYHKLLPDMAPELKGRIKTLVLDLDDLLVHKEWTRQNGWKIYKRPGVQDFLLEMGGYYELVVFTDATATYAEPIINKLDPHRVVLYRLYRPETQYHNGKHVRDLSKLNRDLSQVLMISSDPDAWEFQPENTIKLRPWIKDTSDTTLLDLIPMLQLIATKGVKDVRDVVRSYDGEEDVAKAFKARMAQISEHQKSPRQRSLLSLSR